MTYEETIKISEDFYNTIDFTEFIHISYGKINIRVEEYGYTPDTNIKSN